MPPVASVPTISYRPIRFAGIGTVSAIALALSALVAPAHAQDEGARERALDLFEQSEAAYNEGDLERAVAVLREAYAIHPEPILLYNLGRALEGLGSLAEAADAYERYLDRAADARDRAALARRIAALREHAPADPPEPAPLEQAPPPPQTNDAAIGASWTIAAFGALALGAAIPLGVLALDRHQAAIADPSADAAWAFAREADDLALATNITLGVGAAVLIAGVIWGIVAIQDRSSDSAQRPLRVRF